MNYIFHIGTHKTGSTALQQFFYENRSKLLEKGVLYPLSGLRGSAHHNIAWIARSGDRKKLDELIFAIENEAKSCGAEHVILSSEEFEFIRNKDLLSPLLGLRPKVVVFLRRQDLYLESEYNQHVKMYAQRYPHDIYRFYFHHDFMPRFNYKFLCDSWEPNKDVRALQVINYDSCSVDKYGIFKAFISKIGIDWDDDFLIPGEAASNVSVPNIGTIYLARINRLDLSQGSHQDAIRVINREFGGLPRRPLLPIDEKLVLWHRFISSNKFINNNYGVESFAKPESSEGGNSEAIDFWGDFDSDIYNAITEMIVD